MPTPTMPRVTPPPDGTLGVARQASAGGVESAVARGHSGPLPAVASTTTTSESAAPAGTGRLPRAEYVGTALSAFLGASTETSLPRRRGSGGGAPVVHRRGKSGGLSAAIEVRTTTTAITTTSVRRGKSGGLSAAIEVHTTTTDTTPIPRLAHIPYNNDHHNNVRLHRCPSRALMRMTQRTCREWTRGARRRCARKSK